MLRWRPSRIRQLCRRNIILHLRKPTSIELDEDQSREDDDGRERPQGGFDDAQRARLRVGLV